MKYARRTSVLRAFVLYGNIKKWKRITNGIENGCRERVLTTVCDNKIIESVIKQSIYFKDFANIFSVRENVSRKSHCKPYDFPGIISNE